jgi:hypothetical protein
MKNALGSCALMKSDAFAEDVFILHPSAFIRA